VDIESVEDGGRSISGEARVCSSLGVFPLTWSSILGVVCPEPEDFLLKENLDNFIDRRDRDRAAGLEVSVSSTPFSVSFS